MPKSGAIAPAVWISTQCWKTGWRASIGCASQQGLTARRAAVGRKRRAAACPRCGQDTQLASMTHAFYSWSLYLLEASAVLVSICPRQRLQNFSGNIKNLVQQQTFLVHVVWDLGLSQSSAKQGWLHRCASCMITKGLVLWGVLHST